MRTATTTYTRECDRCHDQERSDFEYGGDWRFVSIAVHLQEESGHDLCAECARELKTFLADTPVRERRGGGRT